MKHTKQFMNSVPLLICELLMAESCLLPVFRSLEGYSVKFLNSEKIRKATTTKATTDCPA